MVGIGPEDIFEGNAKLILGVIWVLIMRYQLQPDTSASMNAKSGLLEWVRSKIPECNIKNFTSDWQSGKALCALVEATLPGQMILPRDFTNDPEKDCAKAIALAKDNMNIPPIIDASDMVNIPEELSALLYISYFRDFLGSGSSQQAKDSESTPVATNCIAYGKGLETGNRAETPTSFVIEARDDANRNILCSTDDLFTVSILGPHGSIISSTIKKGKNGNYEVTYVPRIEGCHYIEITLTSNKEHIKNSRFDLQID